MRRGRAQGSAGCREAEDVVIGLVASTVGLRRGGGGCRNHCEELQKGRVSVNMDSTEVGVRTITRWKKYGQQGHASR